MNIINIVIVILNAFGVVVSFTIGATLSIVINRRNNSFDIIIRMKMIIISNSIIIINIRWSNSIVVDSVGRWSDSM